LSCVFFAELNAASTSFELNAARIETVCAGAARQTAVVLYEVVPNCCR
jgi:hypothetical protein